MKTLEPEIEVAKRKPTAPRNDEAIRIRSEVAAKARIAAAFAGESLTEYISNLLEPILTKAISDGYAKISKGPTVPKSRNSER